MAESTAENHNDLAHLRAAHAWKRVNAWSRAQEVVQEVKGAPVAVRGLGLGQAVATLARRSAGGQIAEDVATWLLAAAPPALRPLGTGPASAVGLVERIVGASPAEARAAEEEAIRYLEVLKLLGELKHGKTS